MKRINFLFFPFAVIYGLITAVRNQLFDRGIIKSTCFNVPVISVGNISVGGTGKTPHIEWLINLLKDRKVVVLSRGYGRKTKGFRWVNEKSLSTNVGDEPLQIKLGNPKVAVAVCEKRVIGVQNILHNLPDTEVILLDDAYQHRHIKPSFSILLNDYNQPIYKDWMLPLGRKREYTSGKKRADVIITSKCPGTIKQQEQWEIRRKLNPDIQQYLFFSFFQYDGFIHLASGDKIHVLENQSIILLTGIANPKLLLRYFEGKVMKHFQFADHYMFSEKDILNIKNFFQHNANNNPVIVTTTKDAVRLFQYKGLLGDVYKKIYVLPVKVAFAENTESEIKKIIIEHVNSGTGSC